MLYKIIFWALAGAAGNGDSTPGGSANAVLMEDNSSGILMEDGTSDILMEA